MATKYDAKIIEEFAERLYKQAGTVESTYGIVGALIGVGGGFVVGNGPYPISALIGLIAFGAIGFMFGRERAFTMKLQAQMALCQAKIEENTRSGPES